jgi:hypothetical protein
VWKPDHLRAHDITCSACVLETQTHACCVLICVCTPAVCVQAEKCFDSFAYYQSVMDFAGYHSINPDISKVRQPAHHGLVMTCKPILPVHYRARPASQNSTLPASQYCVWHLIVLSACDGSPRGLW